MKKNKHEKLDIDKAIMAMLTKKKIVSEVRQHVIFFIMCLWWKAISQGNLKDCVDEDINEVKDKKHNWFSFEDIIATNLDDYHQDVPINWVITKEEFQTATPEQMKGVMDYLHENEFVEIKTKNKEEKYRLNIILFAKQLNPSLVICDRINLPKIVNEYDDIKNAERKRKKIINDEILKKARRRILDKEKLRKEACIKCFNNDGRLWAFAGTRSPLDTQWEKDGLVYCSCKPYNTKEAEWESQSHVNYLRSVKKIPKNCPYRYEHINGELKDNKIIGKTMVKATFTEDDYDDKDFRVRFTAHNYFNWRHSKKAVDDENPNIRFCAYLKLGKEYETILFLKETNEMILTVQDYWEYTPQFFLDRSWNND